jgi:hypothetical protein
MSKAEILEAIAKLAPEEREEIRHKLDELDGDAWDQQIEADAKSGKLDSIYDQLKEEDNNEPVAPLDEFLDDKKLS